MRFPFRVTASRLEDVVMEIDCGVVIDTIDTAEPRHQAA